MYRERNDEQTIKMDFMTKRSQMKKKFTYENYKSRWFVLTSRVLRYHEGTLENGPKSEKGRIRLGTVTAVEEVDDGALNNKQNSFQVVYREEGSTCTLYILAIHKDQRAEWMELLRKECDKNGARLSRKYHPGVWSNRERRYSCCDCIARDGNGCMEATQISKPEPPRPDLKGLPDEMDVDSHREEEEGEENGEPGSVLRRVIAIYDYNHGQPGDLSLTKGEEYDILNDTDTGPHWWKAQNKRGDTGFIPSNYVQVVTKEGLEKYDWFYPLVTRAEAEGILRSESKEGCFLLRNASQQGMYSLSLYSKDLNPQGVVRHYHVKKTEDGKYYFSDKHAYDSIPDLVNYHRYNCAGLVVRLRTAPSNKTRNQPATAGLGHEILMYAQPYAQDVWEIDRNELRFEDEIGKGQFGTVMRAKWKNSFDVAVKLMQKEAMQEDDFLDEAQTMKQLQHPNLVQLYGVCSKVRPICLVMEYMVHGALLFFLRKHKRKLLTLPPKLVDMSVQVARGMEYLEGKGFIHRDLAARNCLVGANNRVKVADFGLTRFVLDDDYTSSAGAKFPIKWAPPEVLQYCRFSSKADVWAFGVLMWEIFTGGDMPYGKARNHDVVHLVVSAKERLDQPQSCPNDIFNIMSSCWEMTPDERPSFQQLVENLARAQEEMDYPRHAAILPAAHYVHHP